MAISTDHPGLTVEVIVDRRPLQEYDDDEEAPPKTTVKYIESQSGKEFAIRIDGGKARTLWREPHRIHRDWINDHINFKKDGQNYQAKYCFTALQIVEGDPSVHDIPALHQEVQSKGRIEICFWRLANIRTVPSRKISPRKSTSLPEGFSAMGSVPEKALKGDARSHQATLSDPLPVGPRESSGVSQTYDYVDVEPFAIFRFEYRSIAGLRALQLLDKDDNEGREDWVQAGKDGNATGSFVKQEAISLASSKRARATLDHDDGEDDVVFVEARTVKRPRGEVIID